MLTVFLRADDSVWRIFCLKVVFLSAKLHKLVECAVMVALATVLSFIIIWKQPLGGSVTLLSMLPICLVGFRHGPGWGFGAAFVYSVVQLMLGIGEAVGWGLTPVVLIGCILLDYLLAYTSLGLTGLFCGAGWFGMTVGVVLSMAARFVCHFLSGVLLFAEWRGEGYSAVGWSIVYNGAFMLPEMVFTAAAVILLARLPETRKLLFGR